MTERVYHKNAIQVEATFTVMDCARCGVLFGIPTEMETRRLQDGQSFYCPNGHSLGWAPGEADKLRAERDEATAALQAERGRARQLGNDLLDKVQAEQRMAKRVHAGVCPLCQRTFVQLRRHMVAKHPRDARDAAEAAADRKPKSGKATD